MTVAGWKSEPRLLLIAPWLAPGGADKFNLDLVRQLSGSGWAVTIATTRHGDHSWLPHFAPHAGIHRLSESLSLPQCPQILADLLQAESFDIVVITHSDLGYRLLPYLRRHAPEHTAFVDYSHVVEPGWGGGYPRLAVERQSLLDLNIVSSEHLRSWMGEQGANPRRIEVAYTGVDPLCWRPDDSIRARVRQELALPTDLPVVLFAGRVCAQKQPHGLVQTVAALRDRHVDCATVIAGEGPDLEWCRSFIGDHALTRETRVLGGVSNDRVRELMAAADVFFLPSAYEGIAVTIYEAMATGLATVSADVGGQKELLTEDCGILIARNGEEREVEAYAEALSSLLRDLPRRRHMGNRARARVQDHFRTDQMGTRMIGMFEHASTLRHTQPRRMPSASAANRSAHRAVRAAQLSETGERRWSARDRRAPRVRAYDFIARRLQSWYRWGVRRGWRWLPTVRDRVRLVLLGKTES